jgi:ornithine decarboxylase
LYKHHSALGVALSLKPAAPVTLIRPQAAARAARYFVEKFPGRSLYAVKANPSPELLKTLWSAGISHYDVASIAEVRLVARTLPK